MTQIVTEILVSDLQEKITNCLTVRESAKSGSENTTKPLIQAAETLHHHSILSYRSLRNVSNDLHEDL